MAKEKQTFLQKYERHIEASTWVIIIAVLFGVRFLPQTLIDSDQAYILIGLIIGFVLLYYLVIYKYFKRASRLYIKDIADIVLIGVLVHVLKDYGTFFYALYFLPIAAAALTLEFINALLIATIAASFVAAEIFLSAQSLLDSAKLYEGAWQIGFILLITMFCRFLAIQIRQERRQKEESLARQRVLEEESRREKEFMSLTSHQLYTPLSIIRGFASMLKDDSLGKLSAKQKEAVWEIHGSSARMVNLVSELLSISRIQSGIFQLDKKPTDLGQMLQNIVNQFNQTKTNQQVSLTLKVSDNLSPVTIDADKIRQVIYNLLDNALKYSQKGTVTVNAGQDDKETTVAVADEGIGIDEQDTEKLFQPFFRGKNILELDNKGTGLGLYIARLLVEKHGGKIWAESQKGQGSTFKFTLPMVK